jgi:hypothetical protein
MADDTNDVDRANERHASNVKAASIDIGEATIKTNLRSSVPGEMKSLFRLTMTDAISLLGEHPPTLSVVGIMQKPREETDRETGEVKGKTTTKFLCEDGKIYFTEGGPVAEMAGLLLLAAAGSGQFKPAVVIHFNYKPNKQRGVTILPTVDDETVSRLVGF